MIRKFASQINFILIALMLLIHPVSADDELDDYIRSKADTAYHPCGTCKMGVDDMAVVDENLKVKGIENLRVIDASVIPEIPSANLNAPVLMIAEKGSELVLN